MANFAGPGFSAGFARGANVAQTKRQQRLTEAQLQQAKTARAQERLKDAFALSKKSADEDFAKSLDLIAEAGTRGATDEQFQALRERAMQGPQSYAFFLAEQRARARASGASDAELELLPNPGEIIANKQAVLDGAIDVALMQAQAGDQTFELLSPEEVKSIGFPKGTIAQRRSDGQLSIVLEPDQQDQPMRVLSVEDKESLGFPSDSIVQQSANGKLSIVFEPDTDESTISERTRVLVESGVPAQTAQGIAAGRFAISVNPITNERQVIDVATGERVGGSQLPGPTGEAIAMLPEDLDTASATGLPGILRNTANVIAGAFNSGLPFEQSQEATDALRSIQEFTGITLQAEVPGRPSNFLQQRLRELTVAPNSITQGRERARSRLQQTQRLIAGEIARIENEVLTQELQPQVRVETNLNLSRLKRLDEAYGTLISGLGNPPDQEQDVLQRAREALDAGDLDEARRLMDQANGRQ